MGAQQVVLGETEVTDGRVGSQTTMWPIPVVGMNEAALAGPVNIQQWCCYSKN